MCVYSVCVCGVLCVYVCVYSMCVWCVVCCVCVCGVFCVYVCMYSVCVCVVCGVCVWCVCVVCGVCMWCVFMVCCMHAFMWVEAREQLSAISQKSSTSFFDIGSLTDLDLVH